MIKQPKNRNPFKAPHVILLLAFLILAATGIIYALADFSVSATVETQNPKKRNADDPAIWIHPSDPSLSVVIGTFKTKGLALYDLDGAELHFEEQDGGMNNVDLRYNFPLGDQKVALVVATNRDTTHDTLAMYKMNPTTRLLENVTADPPIVSTTGEVYGTCMYVSPDTGEYYGFITSKSGLVEQWKLSESGDDPGKVKGTLVRSFTVTPPEDIVPPPDPTIEGCVADDVFGSLYLGQEDVGIWRYGAEPGDDNTGTVVDLTGTGNLTEDVEGLSIYYTNDNRGYLLASSQGASEYVIYDRLGDNTYLTTFNIVEGNGIDGTESTDGLDVTNVSLGPNFPQGVFIVHDGNDDLEAKNFKLVPWQDIAAGADPDLKIDTSWDPRLVGLPPTAEFSADDQDGAAPLAVKFSDQSSAVRTSWLWDFGDGSTSTAPNPSHTYAAEGLYTVSLTVSNSFGADKETKADYIQISETPSAPAAAFEADVTNGEAPLTVTFSNLSSGGINTCLWDFGDGQTNSGCADPIHTYLADGIYDVSLTVTGPGGNDTMKRPHYIIVGEPWTVFLPLTLTP